MAGTLTRIVDSGGERSQNEGIRSDLTVVYRVSGLTGGTGAEAEAEAISGFPANNSTFGGSGPYASLTKSRHEFDWLNPKKTEGRVICRYQSPNRNTQSGDPASRLPIIRWGTQLEQRPLVLDWTTPTRKEVKNTAGQPFDPPLVTQVGNPYVEVTLWKAASYFTGTIVPLIAKCPVVNDANFSIDGVTFSAGKLLLTIESAEKEYEGGGNYYRIGYRFQINNETWDLKPASYGYYEWDGTNWQPIVDAEGNPVSRPWPLDSSGAAVADPTTTNGFVMTFKPYQAISFGALV
jgi:hypothetical protein